MNLEQYKSPLQDEQERYAKLIVSNNLICNFSLNNYLFESLNNRIIVGKSINIALADNASSSIDFTGFNEITKPLSSDFNITGTEITGFKTFSINKITTTIIITSAISVATQFLLQYVFNNAGIPTTRTNFIIPLNGQNLYYTKTITYLPLDKATNLNQLKNFIITKLTGDNPIDIDIIISIQKIN